MLKHKNLIYSLIGLNIILLIALIFYKLPPTVEAQSCVAIPTGFGNCQVINTNQGVKNRDAKCPPNQVLTGMHLFCSEDCGDRDEDWVVNITCCSLQ